MLTASHALRPPFLLQTDMSPFDYPQNPLPRPQSAGAMNSLANLAQMAQAAGVLLLLVVVGAAGCGWFGSGVRSCHVGVAHPL
jgi:hypothetical protein